MSKMSYHHTPLGSPLDGRLWHQLLDTKAEQEPDTEAAIFYDMSMQRSTLTYAEYRDRSVHLAASLLQLGLSYGQRALLIGTSGPKYLISIMALHRIGAKAILMGPGDFTTDKANLLKKLDCRLIAYDPEMTDSQTKQLMKGIGELVQHNVESGRQPQIILSLMDQVNNSKEIHDGAQQEHINSSWNNSTFHTYQELIKPCKSQDQLTKLLETQEKVQMDDEIVALFTSGSTGKPKVVQHTVHSLANILAGSPFPRNGPRSKSYCDRPLSWIGGYVPAKLTLLMNTTLVHVPVAMAIGEPANENIFKVWMEEKCSSCGLNTVLMAKLLKDSMHLKYDLSHIKMFILAGQHFHLPSIKAILKVLPDVKFSLTYGCTESPKAAGQFITQEQALDGVYGKMTVAPGVEIKIIDDENKIVPRGTPGEICTRNSSVFLEYLENPEATMKTKSKTGWLHTGDIGSMDDQGKIQILGRKSTIIKRLTVKIFPSEIEKVIQQYPLVAEVIVVGIPDQQLHEEICACVILRQDKGDESRDEKAKLQELEEWCEEQWPPRADGLSLKPKYFLSMKKFPCSVSGKTFAQGIRDEAMKLLGE